jgi:putative endonuclease
MRKRAIGDFGEGIAVDYLRRHGYRIVDRNWRVRQGEIDIIAEKENEIVFVEVKTRTSDLFGGPEESMTIEKQNRVIRASLAYLHNNNYLQRDWRVDFIGIYCTHDQEVLELEHFENIIQGPIEDFL